MIFTNIINRLIYFFQKNAYNQTVRISNQDKQSIITTFKQIFGDQAKLYLFGSRVDDAKRGGDLDLYIKLPAPINSDEKLNKKITFITKLNLLLGDQKIDVVINDTSDEKLIYRVAEIEGIKLW